MFVLPANQAVHELRLIGGCNCRVVCIGSAALDPNDIFDFDALHGLHSTLASTSGYQAYNRGAGTKYRVCSSRGLVDARQRQVVDTLMFVHIEMKPKNYVHGYCELVEDS
jgi:hypothetical protein